MPRIKRTPPMAVKGRFTVAAPFVIQPNNVYEVIALRYFEDVVADGEDVFKSFYEPVNLTQAIYKEDLALKAYIVTLRDPHGNFVFIPDTYITSFPNITDYEYHHFVASVSLGALPNYVDFTFMKQEIEGVVNKILGITPTVLINSAPKQGVVTPAQHEVAEANRAAAITMNESVYARVIRQQAIIDSQTETISALTQALINAGVIVP